MTHATIWKNDKTVVRVLVKGHADYASYGSDIVCSSISTAMILTANLISRLAKENQYKITIEEEDVVIDIEIIEFDKYDVLANIMENLFDSLEEIQTQYPKHLKITIKD